MGITRLTNWLRSSRPARNTRRVPGTKLDTQKLEDRTTPAIFTVTWDGVLPAPALGSVTLQEAILAANLNPGPDQIIYGNNPNTGGPVIQSIVLSAAGRNGPLPDITETLTIDGTTTNATKAVVRLNSTSKADPVGGFVITDGALTQGINTIIRNLDITDNTGTTNFNAVPTETGILINAAGGGVNLQNLNINNIDGNAIAVNNSPNNIIGGAGDKQRLFIGSAAAPNNGNGVFIFGSLSIGNLVQQSTISGNAGDGVLIQAVGLASKENIVGGFTNNPVNSGNIINKNNGSGVHLIGSSNTRIQRNTIGTDLNGTTGIPNARHGIHVEQGSANSIIGGNDLTAGNNISGNTENGIYIVGATSSGNQIQSNIIGIDPSATNKSLPNSGNGILVENAANTKLGSTTTAANFVGGNNLHGIAIIGAQSAGSVVVNNRVGIGGASLNVLDTKLGNVQDGIFVSGSTNITVGGGGTNAQNIIGANRNGIAIVGGSSVVNLRGNQLGVHRLGGVASPYANIGNLQDGVFVQDSSSVVIGGTQNLEGNKFAGNRNGVRVINSSGITLQGNFIGTNLTGTVVPTIIGLVEEFQPAQQAEDGVLVEGSTDVKIGTPAQNGGNLISRNRHGVSITKGSSNVLIQNNRIGTQSVPGTFSKTQHDLGNLDDGVFIDASSNVLIGGTGPSEGNLLAKNLDGIQISNGSSNVTVQANEIRNNSQSGVRIEASSNVLIGGKVATAKNTIQNRRLAVDTTFTLDGVFIVSGSTNNTVQGNFIGTDKTNITTNGLRGNGVLIDGSSSNFIGMTSVGASLAEDLANATAEQNIIHFNLFNGIAVVESTGAADFNRLSGNSIANNGRLGIDLGNTAGDVTLNDNLDADGGANNQQNFPSLVLAQSTVGTGTRIQGTLHSTPNRNFRIEFFHIDVPNPTGNPTNFGQGRTYLGSSNVTTDGGGNASYTFINANVVLPAGQFIAATTIDLVTSDTSEFSLTQVIEGAPGPITYVVNNDGNIFPTEGADLLIPANGAMTIGLAIRLANEHPGADRIVFALHPQYTISGSTITYYQESRNMFTNGDLPEITDTLIIDGSPLAWPQVKGGDKRFLQNYGIVFNKASRGLIISDNPTAQSKFANPNAKSELVVMRHLSLTGSAGVGIDVTTQFGGANFQDMAISGFGSDGIRIVNSPNNIVGGSGANQKVTINNISGTGVNIIGAKSTFNLVQQTDIGTTFGAGGNGIWIQSADNNTIGGFTAGSGVNIRASAANGIYLVGSSGTRIQRSVIGDPANVFPNKVDGIRVEDSAKTLIGGVSAGAGNNISGNTEHGIRVVGALSAGLNIQSNQIGTSAAPNSGNGIFVNDVPNVLIGSTVTAANNVDGNNLNGIYIFGPNAKGARIVNTSVGKGGGNLIDGIVVEGGGDVIIGSATSNAGGTINGNRRGISLIDTEQIIIQQMTVQNNSEEGIRMENAKGVLIGGITSTLAANKINSNRDGIRAQTSSNITIQGNSIQNQSEDGVIIVDSTGTVVVGSPFQNGGNKIGGNRNGVRIFGGTPSFTIQNNIIGAGTGSTANTDDGIRLDGIFGAIVGGNQPLSANIVSGNRNGLHLTNGTNNATVHGNTFSNSTENGISLEGSSDNFIGRQTVAERNIISSNKTNGIFIGVDFTNPLFPIFSNRNTIQGNFIGTDSAGTGVFGNSNAGIYIDGGSNNLIGGTVHDTKNKLEEGNIIANSGANGVAVVIDNGPAVGNAIIGNRIFNSGLLAIDLGGNTGLVEEFNDLQDPDGGANNLQNFPVITSAKSGSIATLVSGTINSTPNRSFRIELFGDTVANPNGSPSGYGEGRTFLGATNVTTDGFGDATFAAEFNTALTAGSFVSATATDLATGDTSEFAESEQVEVAVGLISGIKFNDLNGNGNLDTGEPGLPGWVINLDFRNDGTIDAKATTDAAGKYSFVNLTDGIYKLSETLKNGWVQTRQPNPNPVQISGELPITDQNFGNFDLVSISGHKFDDQNGNAKKDAGEGPMSGVTIQLWQVDNKTGLKKKIATTLTDLSGNYIFQNLGPLSLPVEGLGPIILQVRETPPPGTVQSTPNPADIIISSGSDVTGIDFGNKPAGGGGGGGGFVGDGVIVVGSDAGGKPAVRVLKATDQSQLFSFMAFDPNFKGGVRVAKGDINGDGTVDYIVSAGAGGGPHVRAFSGTDGKELRSFYAFDPTFSGGVFVGSADVNRDGFDDIIAAAGPNGGPHVKVFDGQTGFELFNFFAYDPTFTGGVNVTGADVDGDGFADIITGTGSNGGPHVKVFSGATYGQPVAPTVIRSFMAYAPTFTGGVFVAAAHITNDNKAEIVVGPGKTGGPNVRVFDGGTTSVLLDFMAFNDSGPPGGGLWSGGQSYFNGVRVASADVNADGTSDIVVGSGPIQTSRVVAYNGKDVTNKLMDINPVFDPSFMGGVWVG